MDQESVKRLHADLNARVKYFRWHYYYGTPLMGDRAFDILYNNLTWLESAHPYLVPDQTMEVAPTRNDEPPCPF